MRIRGFLREFLSVELFLLLLLKGKVSGFLSSSNNGVSRLNYPNSFLTSPVFQLALVSLSMPWTISGDSITASATKKIEGKVGNATFTASSSKSRRKSKNLPQKQTTANNALLANIDFLTQLTNSKQEKNAEMDPLKCFPKALCGLSAESAAITRRRKNGLIADYIRLMKAVALNPSVMEKTLKRLKEREDEQPQEDEGKDSAESEEEQDDDDEDEEEDEEAEQRGQPVLSKRTNPHGYGYGSISVPKPEPKVQNDGPPKKRTKRKEIIPKDSNEFTKQYLQERAHVERLQEDGFYNEGSDTTNWWAYENEKEPELEELVDFSGARLDSTSAESYYTFGSKRKPNPPTPPHRPDGPPQPQAPYEPSMNSPAAPPRPQPPQAPVVRVPVADSDYESTGTVATIGKFFRGLFGFGSGGGSSDGSFSTDPFFQGFQRSLPDGTPTVVTVDKTKEILTTAIEIGETLRSPNQCNSLFNGCKYQYVELLHVIDDIRSTLEKRGKDNFYSSTYSGNDEENDSGAKADDTHSSYGYKSSLSETSQAETLSPDYAAAASSVTEKNGRRKKKKPSYRDGREGMMGSMSSETSIEIGSDEPTMYGSGQQNFDFHKYGTRHGHSLGPHRHHNQPSPSHYNHHHQGGGYQQSYQFEDMHIRQPKTIWGTILSWFGFR